MSATKPLLRAGITGALGFIGKALAVRISREGGTVAGFDLADDKTGFLQSLGGRHHRGDVTDREALRQFSRGLDRVYHTAAIVKESGDWGVFRRVNVEGARAAARAAREAGAREFVHFSSVMVYGFDYPDEVREAGPLDPAGNPYCATKIESEAAVLELHEPGRFDVYVIRPGDVYGPASIPWTVRPVQMMKQRRWIYVDARKSVFNHVYIDNLLDGIDVVLRARAAGRPFAITDDARTTAYDFFSHYQRFLGRRFVPALPGQVAKPLAAVLEQVTKPLGIDLDVNREAVRYMLRKGKYNIDAVNSLGYRPQVSLTEGMERTHRWLIAEGLVPAARGRQT